MKFGVWSGSIMATVMDGKALASDIKREVKEEVKTLDRKPGLAVILVGENAASRIYITSKQKDCAECGLYSEEYLLPLGTTQQQLIELINKLNYREDINGILVQLPLPIGFDTQ